MGNKHPACLLLSRYGTMGASSRIRFYQYLPFLRRQGFRVDVAPLLGDAYLTALYGGRPRRTVSAAGAYFDRLFRLLRFGAYDLLWIEGELFPWLPPWIEQFLSAAGVKFMADYDDALFHRYDMAKNPLIRAVLGKKIDAIMSGAALITTGNAYLARRAARAGAKRIRILPSVVDLDRYRIKPSPANQRFTIGWIGSPVTTPFLREMGPILSTVCLDHKACLQTVGAENGFAMGPVPLTRRPWSEETEVRDISGFDVGIMPLPDNPWTRGKCGYKLIQYMACAKPVCASAVGVNTEIVDHGKNGFLVETEAEWVAALERLAEDPGLREKMGRHGRRKVEEYYSLQQTAPKLADLIRALYGG